MKCFLFDEALDVARQEMSSLYAQSCFEYRLVFKKS